MARWLVALAIGLGLVVASTPADAQVYRARSTKGRTTTAKRAPLPTPNAVAPAVAKKDVSKDKDDAPVAKKAPAARPAPAKKPAKKKAKKDDDDDDDSVTVKDDDD
jgi:hypothetical protein